MEHPGEGLYACSPTPKDGIWQGREGGRERVKTIRNQKLQGEKSYVVSDVTGITLISQDFPANVGMSNFIIKNTDVK